MQIIYTIPLLSRIINIHQTEGTIETVILNEDEFSDCICDAMNHNMIDTMEETLEGQRIEFTIKDFPIIFKLETVK